MAPGADAGASPTRRLGWVERKLATVLFVDLVDSTLARHRPPTPRSFAGASTASSTRSRTASSPTAAWSRSSPATRSWPPSASRGARGRRGARRPRGARDARRRGELGLQARIGIESGEVVAEEADSTFATGRGRQRRGAPAAGGRSGRDPARPGVHGLARGRSTPRSSSRSTFGPGPRVSAWRLLGVATGARPRRASARRSSGANPSSSSCTTPTSARSATIAPHLVTIYGDPGVGKSRLAASSSRASKARPSLPAAPSLRRGNHVLAAGRDGEGRGRNRRRRPDCTGAREAPHLLRRRRGRRPARARLRRPRRRRRRPKRAGDRLGRARVGRPSSPTRNPWCSSSRTSTGPRSRCST